MFYLLAILFAAAPAYIIRFNIGALPLNLLEILVPLFLIAFGVWLAKKKLLAGFYNFLKKQAVTLWVLIGLFLLAGIISAWISPDPHRAAGLYLVWFLEPLLIYFPAAYILAEPANKMRFVKIALILVALFSAYAIVQYFTLLGLPQAWWGNAAEPKRALSVFEYPNAFALYLAPLLAFLTPFFFGKNLNWFYKICYILGIIGLLLSLSRGGWMGFGIALIIYLAAFANNQIRKFSLLAALAVGIIVLAVPNLRYRVILPFKGEKSTVSRFSLWHTADKMIKDSPILGKGLYGYKTLYDRYNTDPNLPSINFPHNIFLNFWVETGLLGLISFLGISIYFFWRAAKAKSLAAIGVMLFLVALYVHGTIDAPYMKNDLALIFWIIMATI